MSIERRRTPLLPNCARAILSSTSQNAPGAPRRRQGRRQHPCKHPRVGADRCRRSRRGRPFVGRRTDVADRRVSSPWVVEHLEVIEQRAFAARIKPTRGQPLEDRLPDHVVASRGGGGRPGRIRRHGGGLGCTSRRNGLLRSAGASLAEVFPCELPSRARLEVLLEQVPAGCSSSNSTTTSLLQGRFAAVCGDRPALCAERRAPTSDVRPT